MSRLRIVLLAVTTIVAVVVVGLTLLHRERTRDYLAKPPPSSPQAKVDIAPPTPATAPALSPTPTQAEAPVAVVPPATSPVAAAPTTPVVPTPPTTQAAPPPPPPAVSPPPANEDGIALLPGAKLAAPAPAPAAAVNDAAMFVGFAPGGRVLVARASGRMEFIHLATGQRQAIEMKLAGPRAVAVSPAGDRVAVANAESADIWHVTSSTKTHLAGGDVAAIAFARGGQLITGHSGGDVKIWDGPTWTSATTLRPNVGAVAHIAQSPTTAHLAVIGASGGVAVCDIGDHTVKQRLGADQAWSSVAFASDGHTIAAAGTHGIAMWDTMLWQTRPAPGGNEAANHVAFWRGGTVLVTASSDGAIRIYDLATRQPLTTLSGAKEPIVSIDLSDDGRTIAAVNGAAVTVWDSVARSSRQLQ
jgi:hypothetical protein